MASQQFKPHSSDDFDDEEEYNHRNVNRTFEPYNSHHQICSREDSRGDGRKEKGGRESMSSWLQRQANSRGFQLAATAVLSGAVVAGAIHGYQSLKRAEAVDELKASIPNLSEKHRATKVCSPSSPHCDSQPSRLVSILG